MATCNVCNKEFKNPQGLSGHNRFVHGMKTVEAQHSCPATKKSPIELGGNPTNTESNIGQPPDNLEGRLQRLERVTGIGKASASEILNDLFHGRGYPLPTRLNQQLTELGKVSQQVKELTEQVSQLTKYRDGLAELLREITRQVCQLRDDLETIKAAKAVSNQCLAQSDGMTPELEATKSINNGLQLAVNSGGEHLKKIIVVRR